MWRKTANRFRHDESGATAVEYALMLMAVAFALFSSMPTVQSKLSSIFNSVTPGLS